MECLQDICKSFSSCPKHVWCPPTFTFVSKLSTTTTLNEKKLTCAHNNKYTNLVRLQYCSHNTYVGFDRSSSMTPGPFQCWAAFNSSPHTPTIWKQQTNNHHDSAYYVLKTCCTPTEKSSYVYHRDCKAEINNRRITIHLQDCHETHHPATGLSSFFFLIWYSDTDILLQKIHIRQKSVHTKWSLPGIL